MISMSHNLETFITVFDQQFLYMCIYDSIHTYIYIYTYYVYDWDWTNPYFGHGLSLKERHPDPGKRNYAYMQ